MATDDSLSVWLDAVRSTSFLDVGRYASVLALGAFCENVALTARSLGLVHQMEENPDVTLDAPMVRFRFDARRAAEAHPLHAMIGLRCTNRRPHEGAAIGADVMEALAAALADDAELAYSRDDDRKRDAARILAEADVLRMRHRLLHRQMWEEVRFGADEVERTRDGVDVATLELPPGAAEAMAAFTDYDFVSQNISDEQLLGMSVPPLEASSQLCCLSLSGPPDARSLLAAGRGLQRLWLTATRLELALQPWAVLPFFLLRQRFFAGEGFADQERATLSDLGRRLAAVFALADDAVPLFTFRLARCGPPSKRALRLDWRSYTTVNG